VSRGDRELGPYTTSMMAEAVTKGIVRSDDWVWRPGWDEWQVAGTVPGLFRPPPLAPHNRTAPQALTAVGSAQVATRRSNYIARHWKGELSLPVSFWLNTVCLNLAIGLAFVAAEHTKLLSRETALLSLVFALTLAIWQSMGVIRSANRHPERGGRLLWANLAQLVVCLGWVALAGDIVRGLVGAP
jgi:GYF domain 2